jgi:ribonuclease R
MLKDLVAEGKLIQLGRAYGVLEHMNLITGKVQTPRSGVSFLIPDDPRRKDVFLGQDTGGAWNGDRVAVAITRENAARNHECRVVRIVNAAVPSCLCASCARLAQAAFCRPTDPRSTILAEGVTRPWAQQGDVPWPRPANSGRRPVGGHHPLAPGAGVLAQVQEALVKANHSVLTTFPDDALCRGRSAAAGSKPGGLRRGWPSARTCARCPS